MIPDLISVIVPIYNVEDYIRQCFDSLLHQTYQNFEVLMINDGSPDNSASICQEYAARDSRFRYFEKENGGISTAVNLGIEHSQGEYVTLMDPDDWADNDYLEVLYNAIVQEGADVSISSYKRFDMSNNSFYFHAFTKEYGKKVFTNKEFLESLPDLVASDYSFFITASKLVRKEMIGLIRFNADTKLAMDMEFWYKVYLKVNKVVFVNRDIYTYRIHSTSAANNLTVEKLKSSMQHRLAFIAILAARGINIESYVQDYIRHLYDVMAVIENQGLEADETLRWIREMMYLLTFKNEE
jgi:capsular polysaccharide biosynthesis protein cpsJ